MAHEEQIEFIRLTKELFPEAFTRKRVLEIGSLDINGTVRGFFTDCDYIGLDVAPGRGVDLVCQSQDYDAPNASFDTVVCCEVMEHNPYWTATFANMMRLCRPGGLLLMTCASTGRPEHGTAQSLPQESPFTTKLGWDHYRNLTATDFRKAIPGLRGSVAGRFFRHRKPHDLYFVGFRRGSERHHSANGRYVQDYYLLQPLPYIIRRKLFTLRRKYLLANGRNTLAHLKTKTLILLFGEERYWAGPIRPWPLRRPK